MVPAYFDDAYRDLSDNSVGKMFELSKIRTMILLHRALLVF